MAHTMTWGTHIALQYNLKVEKCNSHFDSLESEESKVNRVQVRKNLLNRSILVYRVLMLFTDYRLCHYFGYSIPD